MAYFQRKKGKVYAYYYDKKLGKPKGLKRDITEHLDGMTDDQINKWLVSWEDENGIQTSSRGKRKPALSITAKLRKTVDAYYEYRLKTDEVAERTLENDRSHFSNYILPYFVGEKRLTDFRHWHAASGGLLSYLSALPSDIKAKTKKQIILTCNNFGKYLVDMGHIKESWTLRTPRLRHARTYRTTPLKSSITPESVILAANALRITHPHWAVAILLGYFGSLRPEETMAITRADILTGTQAAKESQTYARLQKHGLGSKLAVQINKALVTGKKLGDPKNFNSNGVVTIWSPEAAILLASIFKNDIEWPLFKHGKSYIFKQYKVQARPKIKASMHDLRRASGLYLGRTIGLDPFLLQDILRHGDLDTVLLYTRRPKDEVIEQDDIDFSDVV